MERLNRRMRLRAQVAPAASAVVLRRRIALQADPSSVLDRAEHRAFRLRRSAHLAPCMADLGRGHGASSPFGGTFPPHARRFSPIGPSRPIRAYSNRCAAGAPGGKYETLDACSRPDCAFLHRAFPALRRKRALHLVVFHFGTSFRVASGWGGASSVSYFPLEGREAFALLGARADEDGSRRSRDRPAMRTTGVRSGITGVCHNGHAPEAGPQRAPPASVRSGKKMIWT